MAKVGEVAERELGALGHGFHSEACGQAAVPLWVHQGKALEVPRGKAGGDLTAGKRRVGVSLGPGQAPGWGRDTGGPWSGESEGGLVKSGLGQKSWGNGDHGWGEEGRLGSGLT